MARVKGDSSERCCLPPWSVCSSSSWEGCCTVGGAGRRGERVSAARGGDISVPWPTMSGLSLSAWPLSGCCCLLLCLTKVILCSPSESPAMASKKNQVDASRFRPTSPLSAAKAIEVTHSTASLQPREQTNQTPVLPCSEAAAHSSALV